MVKAIAAQLDMYTTEVYVDRSGDPTSKCQLVDVYFLGKCSDLS